MKLPSISRNKFEKPQSASSQRPPKGVNIGNLEKNLLMKLNQYDESHNIKYSDSLKLSANFNNDPLDNFLFEESSPIQEVRSNQKQISFKSALEEQEPRARLSTDVKKLKPILLKKTESGQQQPPSQSRGPTKPGAKQVSAQQDLFLTGAEQGDTKNQDESDDSSDEVIRISERQKERDQVRKVMSYPEDEEFSSMHEMLHRTQSDFNETFVDINGLKKTITDLNSTYQALGFGVKQELMDKFEEQYRELLQMQREDDAVDEYLLQQESRPKKGQKKQQQIRATSLAGRKKKRDAFEGQ